MVVFLGLRGFVAILAWNELSAVSDTLERLQRALRRCVGPSRYRDQLEKDIAETVKRRAELISLLCRAVPSDVTREDIRPKQARSPGQPLQT